MLGRYKVFRISMSFAGLFDSIYGRNEPVTFDFFNVERGPRSNFWDHSKHFWTNGFRVIAPNRANFRVKWLNRANFLVKCCFRDDIFTLSCPHLKTSHLTYPMLRGDRGATFETIRNIFGLTVFVYLHQIGQILG